MDQKRRGSLLKDRATQHGYGEDAQDSGEPQGQGPEEQTEDTAQSPEELGSQIASQLEELSQLVEPQEKPKIIRMHKELTKLLYGMSQIDETDKSGERTYGRQPEVTQVGG